jgi:hypothetical protein
MAALQLHIFRVEEGLGNACLLQFPDNTCGFLDWGTQRAKPLDDALQIAKQGKIRFIAASHAHADHTLGLELLIRESKKRNIPVERFVYPASTLHRENSHLTRARIAAKECDILTSPIAVDTFQTPKGKPDPPWLAWADDRSWEVRILSPSVTEIGIEEMKALHAKVVPGNATSLVVLFRFLNAPGNLGRVLLPGDATPQTLEFARQTGEAFPDLEIDNDMFLVPHHGSHHNLPPWVQDHVRGIAVVSAPTNSPNHPSEKTLQLLGRWTCGSKPPRLFCTSYAHACANAFGKNANEKKLVQPGSCFGDITFEISPTLPAQVKHFTVDGNLRRPYGYCNC